MPIFLDCHLVIELMPFTSQGIINQFIYDSRKILMTHKIPLLILAVCEPILYERSN